MHLQVRMGSILRSPCPSGESDSIPCSSSLAVAKDGADDAVPLQQQFNE